MTTRSHAILIAAVLASISLMSCAAARVHSSTNAEQYRQTAALAGSSEYPLDACASAAKNAVHQLAGEAVLSIHPQASGYLATVKPGTVYVELDSCAVGSYAHTVEYDWKNRHLPISLSIPTGPIRNIQVKESNSSVYIRTSDSRGIVVTAKARKAPSDIVYYSKGRQDVFYNFDQPTVGKQNGTLFVFAIVDLVSGPSLRLESVP